MELKEAIELIKSNNAQEAKDVNLKRQNLSHEDLKQVAEAITAHPKKIPLSLRLSHNNLGDKGTQVFLDAIDPQNVPNNFKLYLAWNNIKEQGFKNIAALMAWPIENLSLNLRGNYIGDNVAQILADAIPHAGNNLHLDLRENRFSNEGKLLLADAIAYQRLINHKKITVTGIPNLLISVDVPELFKRYKSKLLTTANQMNDNATNPHDVFLLSQLKDMIENLELNNECFDINQTQADNLRSFAMRLQSQSTDLKVVAGILLGLAAICAAFAAFIVATAGAASVGVVTLGVIGGLSAVGSGLSFFQSRKYENAGQVVENSLSALAAG